MNEKLNCADSFSAETSLHLNIYVNLKITVMIQLKINKVIFNTAHDAYCTIRINSSCF